VWPPATPAGRSPSGWHGRARSVYWVLLRPRVALAGGRNETANGLLDTVSDRGSARSSQANLDRIAAKFNGALDTCPVSRHPHKHSRWRCAELWDLVNDQELHASADVAAADWLGSRLRRFGSAVAAVVPDGFPAYVRILHPAQGPDDRPVRWAEVAAWSGRTMHRLVQFLDGPRVRLPGRDYLLFAGPLAAAPQLGWADPYGYFFPQSPNLFWPQDHAWCVASEIDLFCTLVAGSDDLAEALVGDPLLEAWRVQPDDPIAFDSDQINT
jgi:hypothetical protein